MARLPYLDAPDLPDEYSRVFDEIERTRGFVPNLYRVLAHSPDLMAEFLRMTTAVRAERRLPADLKEIAILAFAAATAAATIRAAHTSPAAAAGLTPEHVSSVATWRHAACYSPEQSAILAYAEEVTRDVRASDATWEAVAAFLDAAQLAELTLVVAFYNMVARVLEPLQVDLDARYSQKNG